jgi:hypothetical protein
MLPHILAEIAPYLAIVAICFWAAISWILRADSYRKYLEKQTSPANPDIKEGVITNKPQVSAVFLISLISILFTALALVCANTITENAQLRQALLLQKSLLAKALADKKTMEKDDIKLKNKIGELQAQKALYTVTIETILKKDDSSR